MCLLWTARPRNAVSRVGSLCFNWKEHLSFCATWCFSMHTFSLEIPLVIFFVLVLFVKLPRIYNVSWVVAAVSCGTKQRQPCRLSATHFLFEVLLNVYVVSVSRPDSLFTCDIYMKKALVFPDCVWATSHNSFSALSRAHGAWNEHLHKPHGSCHLPFFCQFRVIELHSETLRLISPLAVLLSVHLWYDFSCHYHYAFCMTGRTVTCLLIPSIRLPSAFFSPLLYLQLAEDYPLFSS